MSGLDMQIQQVEQNSMCQVAEATIVDNKSFSSVDHLDPIQICLLHSLEMRNFGIHPVKIMFDSFIFVPPVVVRRGDFDTTYVLLDDALVIATRFNEQALHTMLGKLLVQ